MTISEIVPVYNADKYLEKCINSILAQTYRNIEIILIDDGSTDSSPLILDEYAAKDCRIRVIHKANGGAVSARNVGLQTARGEYVGFVDSDDWIEPDYLEKMVEIQKDTAADIVVTSHFHDIGEDASIVSSNFQTGLYTKEQILPTLLYSGHFFEYGLQPHMVTKLFRKEILLKTQMCVDGRIVIGEDAAVVYPSVLEAEKIYISDICGYHYVQHSDSVTKRENSNETEICRLLFEYLERVFREKDVWDIMAPQFEQYRKYILLMRQMQYFDDRVALPFGGISRNSKVVIYGAGVLGQKLYGYLSKVNGMNLVLWVDKNYKNYQEKGMDVRPAKDILGLRDYDYILIANTVQHTADIIRRDLEDMGVIGEKILWFSEDFIGKKG